MFRVSKITDYSIVVLYYLAQRPKNMANLSSRDVACSSGLPQPTVRKILKLLASNNLVSTKRGVDGGYKLSICPKQISLLEIIRALEGPQSVTSCLEKQSQPCRIPAQCQQKYSWNLINQQIEKILQETSLQDLLFTRAPS